MSKLARQVGILVFALAFALAPMLNASAGVPAPQKTGAPGITNTGADLPSPLKPFKDFVGNGKNPNEKVDVVIQMQGRPVAQIYKETLDKSGRAAADREDYQVAASGQLKQAQASVVAAASRVGKVTGQLTVVYNGVAVTGVARRDIAGLYALPGVVDVYIMPNYQLDLHDSVPFVGAEQIRQQLGLDGRNIKIAMLDSGIDYTHRNFGGIGTVAAYDYASTVFTVPVVYSGTQLFPTQKVPDGYDFVGSNWPISPTLEPDPNPLDDGVQAGHGSHTAGIAAGFGVPNDSVNGSIPLDFDGTTIYHGMAPAAQIYAYKVCSSVSTSCSGEAMVLGMERAADPNQNGSTLDHVDAMNMSVGQPFGGDLVNIDAANNAVDAGIAFAMSAGNSSNIPFITGSPANAVNALSVASSTSSGHFGYNLVVNTPVTLTQPIMPFIWQTWSGSITPAVTADLIEARNVVTFTAPSAKLGCTQSGGVNPFPPGSLAGKISVVDRGTCAVSQKAYNSELAGAVGMILVMLPGQEPTAFSSGGEPVTIPAISMYNADMAPARAYMAAGGTVNATIGTSSSFSLTDTLSGFTSRGPSALGALKPDISAPGADIFSTAAGTGDQGVYLSGTSMSAPHVAGALAQMKQLHPSWGPLDLEALLVNSSVPILTVGFDPRTRSVAPISRAGGGRLAVNTAAALQTTVRGDTVASVSFGAPQITGVYTASKTLHITNHADADKDYDLSAVTQFAQSPALQLTVSPATLHLGPNATGTATLTIQIDSALLPNWNLYGSGTGSGANLDAVEMAGWVLVEDTTAHQTARAPWYVLPRKASEVTPSDNSLTMGPGRTTQSFTLNNSAAFTGTSEIYNLMGEDPMETLTQTQYMMDDIHSVGVRVITTTEQSAVIDLLDFGINTYAARSVSVNSLFEVFVDTNEDGTDDFLIYSDDLGYFLSGTYNGQNAVIVVDLATQDANLSGYYTATGINTTNIGMTVPLDMLGMELGQEFDFHVQAYDYASTGELVDTAPNEGHYTFDTGHLRFTPSTYTVEVGEGSTATIDVECNSAATGDSEKGLLVLHQYNISNWREADAIYIGPVDFTDVQTSDWFSGYVEYVSLRGIATGYADGTFRPYANTTRGQTAKMIVTAMNLPIFTPTTPTFTDVAPGSAFYNYVETAVHFGIVSGYADQTFRPNAEVTRGQLAKMVVNGGVVTAGWALLNPATPTFTDVATDNPFYQQIETAAARGIISGYADNTFRWQNNSTRAQVAKMVSVAAGNRQP